MIEPLRTIGIIIPYDRKAKVVVRCDVCGEATRNEKKYCPKHILKSEYVKKVLNRASSFETIVQDVFLSLPSSKENLIRTIKSKHLSKALKELLKRKLIFKTTPLRGGIYYGKIV